MNYETSFYEVGPEHESSYKNNNISPDDIPSIINNEYLESVCNENSRSMEDLYFDLDHLEIFTSNTCDIEKENEIDSQNKPLCIENEDLFNPIKKNSPMMLSKKRKRRK